MAVQFGMTVAQIIGQLTRGFMKAMGRKPDGLEKIKIQQEAVQRFKDMNKVVDMGGRPIDTSKGIMGGFEVGQKGIFDNIFNRMNRQMGNKPKVIDEDTGEGFIDFVKRTDPEGAAKMQKEEDRIRAMIEAANKRAAKNLKNKKKKKDDPEEKAMGGRIGLKEGEGIMQMASDPDPMSEADDISRDMFGKPYKELNEDELEEFREEMERLRNKFVSAPDPMDERNTVMENIAMEEFGRPLKDLNEDQIRQIEEMMEEMTKIDRGAPSITLADGGRAAFKDGPLKRGIKAITGTDTYKTLENKGFNAAVLLNQGFDEIYSLLSGSIPGLAEGGRIGYKDGPKDPGRRTFMKAAAGLASLIPGLGIIGKGAKVAAPVVAKAAEITGPALAKIVDTVMSLGKLVSLKGKRVKEMVTKKKHQGVEVTEDIQDGSYVIKKGDKEIYYKPGRQDETGGFEDDIIEVIGDRIKKAGGGGIGYMLGE